MKKRTLGGICLALVIASSCNTRERAETRIGEMEKRIYSDTLTSFDAAGAGELLEEYRSYTENYPQAKRAPEYLFRSAEVALALEMPQDAVAFLEKLRAAYPQDAKAPTALFMQAFIYENKLNNLPMAQKCYSQFIKECPAHELADDAQFSLDNLGKSEEEILKQLQEKTNSPVNGE